MAIPIAETRQLLSTLFEGRITESERILNTLKNKYPSESRYLKALEGLVLSYVNDDHDSLLFRVLTRKELWKRRAEIRMSMEEKARREGGEDGFFKAWSDILGLLDKLPRPHKLEQVKD
ncbi:hypothetical protein HRbin01_00923 [archaeon HR01]|nr:hypothetical protein HRbin01_00923 [archaeon HR01]